MKLDEAIKDCIDLNGRYVYRRDMLEKTKVLVWELEKLNDLATIPVWEIDNDLGYLTVEDLEADDWLVRKRLIPRGKLDKY